MGNTEHMRKINLKSLLLFIGCCFLFTLCRTAAAQAETTYIRGPILHFFKDPGFVMQAPAQSYQYIADGLLVIRGGKITTVGSYASLKNQVPSKTVIVYYPNSLIMPGFIDTHIHYPQLDMIAAPGGHLFQWLQSYTFPFEQKFKNQKYAVEVSNFFLAELLRNGTTTAMIFSSSYPQAIDALFTAAEQKEMRIITGKVIADRNLPNYLIETPKQAYRASKKLINKWHKKPGTRLLYAIEPRFPPTTSPELFEKIKQLKQEFPDSYLHSHIAENADDVAWTQKIYHAKNYLAVFDQYQLLGPTTILAHGVLLTDAEFARMHSTQTGVAFCPTSNLFLGSGLFKLAKALQYNVRVGMGTDVGAGTSFSMLQTLNEAYKVAQLQNITLSPYQGFYLATLGGAKALNLDNQLGNFQTGKEADFIVLDIQGATPLLKRRLQFSSGLTDKLFALMMLGDDRSIIATYVNGKLVYQR